ncbi:MAG: DUF192 domain-containing protein [Candidatus Nanoarchaeia archaeon]|nr:DUF192 domain-containing protein [Candidatus Nanoarchaeia archaeon]
MSQKICISKNIFIQNSFFKKATGLMFRKKMSDFAMIFPFNKPTKISITMLFVFFKIDVLMLDSENKIIDLDEGLKPFKNYFYPEKAKTFIELPFESISKWKLKKGMTLSWNKSSIILMKP